MKVRTRFSMLAWLTVVATSGGCGGSSAPSEGPRPLARIVGEVAASEPTLEPRDPAVVWMTSQVTSSGDTPKLVLSRGGAAAGAASGFTLDLLEPPSSDSEIRISDSATTFDPQPTGAWVGLVVAVARDTPEGEVHTADIAGVALGHVLLYFDHDVALDASETSRRPRDYPRTAARIFGVAATKGFHLAINDQGSPQAEAAYDQCRWGGVCVHHTGWDDVNLQARLDWDYERCVARTLSPKTCVFDVDSVSAERDRCGALESAARDPARTSACKAPWSHPSNPLGFEATVRVEVGKSVWDVWLQ